MYVLALEWAFIRHQIIFFINFYKFYFVLVENITLYMQQYIIQLSIKSSIVILCNYIYSYWVLQNDETKTTEKCWRIFEVKQWRKKRSENAKQREFTKNDLFFCARIDHKS